MKRSIKSLMLLAVLSLGMNSVCALPAELSSADVQAFMEAKKQRLAQKMITTINDYFAVDATRWIPHEGDYSFFYAFQKRYDEYRSYFPQGDALVDQQLRKAFGMCMKEKLLEIMPVENELEAKIKKNNRYFALKLVEDGFKIGILGCSFLALEKILKQIAPHTYLGLINSCWVGLFGVAGIMGTIAVAIDVFDDRQDLTDNILRFCRYNVIPLNEAYAYAFPEESILSEQVQASLELGE